MKKGIWEDFDGYDSIKEKIKASRIAAGKHSFELDFADQYIKRLHPDRLDAQGRRYYPGNTYHKNASTGFCRQRFAAVSGRTVSVALH